MHFASPARSGLPRDGVVVVGIEGVDFGWGTGLSPTVSAAVPRAVDRVLDLIGEAHSCA